MSRQDESFQKIYNRLIPVVIVFPVLFLIFFIVVSMIQLRDINKRIEEGQSQAIKELLTGIAATDDLTNEQLQFITLAVLEEESLSERYNQGHYSLVSRSFKQFLGFFTGIIMVIVGSVFVLLKLKEKIDLNANQGETWKISLLTTSPGVAFAVTGAILIGIASLTKDVISVRDSGLYLTREYLVAPYFSGSGSREQRAADIQKIHEYMLDQASASDSLDVELIFPPE